jgi:hypothetical protein
MAKDQLGHGSNQRGTGAQGMRLVKTHVLGPHSAKVYKNPDWEENVVKFFHNGVYQSKADSHTNDLADAHATARFQLQRYMDQDAKASLASGPKSDAAPTHDSMTNLQGSIERGHAMRSAGDGRHVSGFAAGGRHGYSPDAVNKAIASSNRSGRRIGGREAKMIHAIIKGRG